MAAKKIYAVRKGKEIGIFTSWEACKASVNGFPGAEYRGFTTRQDAEAYLDGGNKLLNIRSGGQGEFGCDEIPPDGTLLVYVDGSYEDSLKRYAFGCVFLLPDGSIRVECGNGNNEQALQHRNVTGEMLGAMYAVKTAMMNGFRHVELRYDYEGIEKWVTGAWRSKTELTMKYAGAMQEWSERIQITFTKVAAHTNVFYNEIADKLAKKGLTDADGVPKVRKLEDLELWNDGEGEDRTQ